MGSGTKLNGTPRAFFQRHQMFFVATAGQGGRVNASPKGMDTQRILGDGHSAWLHLSGCGNETAAHLRETGRMTLMFCACDGWAMILGTSGVARVLHPRGDAWAAAITAFPLVARSRQIFDLTIDLVQTSCGTGVPNVDFVRSRGETDLVPFFVAMGAKGVKDCWHRRNRVTLDGADTGIS